MGAAEIILRVRDAATPALKAAEKAASALTGAVDDVDKRLKGVGGSISGWAAKHRASFDAMRANIADNAKQYTNLGRVVGWISGGMGTLAKGAGAAALGIGAIAIATAAAAAAAAVMGAAVVAGLGFVVVKAKEAQERLDELSAVREIQIGVSKESQAAIDNVSTSLASMQGLLDAITVAVAANVAPAISRAANVIVGFGVIGLEAFKTFAEGGGSVLEALARFIVQGFVRSLLLPVQAIQLLMRAMVGLGEAIGVPVAAFRAADEGIGVLFDTITDNTIAGGKAIISMSGLSEAVADAEAKGAALNKRMAQTVAGLKAKENATKAATAADKESAAAMENAQRVAVTNWFDQQLAAIEKLKREFDSYVFLPQLQEEIAALTESTAASMAGFTRDLRRVATQARAGRATEAIGRVSSLSGLVGASPVGGAVMAGIGLVADAGKGGGIIPEVQTLLTDFTKGLTVLPDMITGGVKMLVEQIIPGLIDVLPDAIRGIIGALGTALPQLMNSVLAIFLDPKFWLDVGKAIIGGILDALKGLVGNIFGNKEKTGIFQKNGAIAQSIQERRAARGYASGLDYVGQTGVAVIHEGEEIVRRGGSMSMASKTRAGAGGDIYISGVLAADEEALVRKIADLRRRGFSV